MNDITINKSQENSNLQDIKVQSIEKHKEFVFITLVNYQRIIITKDRIYDLTRFDYIEDIFYIKFPLLFPLTIHTTRKNPHPLLSKSLSSSLRI